MTVKAGGAVRFSLRNDDAEAHNLISGQIEFPRNQQDPKGTYTLDWVAPQRAGTYEVFCAFHAPEMKLEIVVQ